MIIGSTRGSDPQATSTEIGSLSNLALRDAWKEFGDGKNRGVLLPILYI